MEKQLVKKQRISVFQGRIQLPQPQFLYSFYVFFALTIADCSVHAILLALAHETEYVSVGAEGCVNSVLPQSQRLARAAVSRSCLLAETDTGTRLRLSSYSNPVSFWSISSNLFLSVLSITSIRISVFSKELPQHGLVFLCPPMSAPSFQFETCDSTLLRFESCVSVTWLVLSDTSCFIRVVLPVLPKPRRRICTSWTGTLFNCSR